MNAMLIVRGLVSLGFGLLLAMSGDLTWEAYFSRLADYLIVDGLIGAGIAAALVREGSPMRGQREIALGFVTFIDASGRLLSGAAIHVWPGIPAFPVTGVLFVAVMAVCTTGVGIVEAWLTAREELAIHGRLHERPQFMAGAVGVASLISLAFGIASVASIENPPRVRLLISGFVVAAGVVAITMAASHRRLVAAGENRPGVS